MARKIICTVPQGAIKTEVLDVRQNTNFSCGAAALHAVCAYWGVGPESEYDYMKSLHSDPSMGTTPQHIIEYAKHRGLKVDARDCMTVLDLKTHLDKGRPVIVLIQAWGDKKRYRDYDENGHYVVAIGYDDKRIYFEEPVMLGHRAFLTYKEFDERWHDEDAFGRKYIRYGMAMWKKGKPSLIHQAEKIG
jgi:predicted double-glycine peptidase